MNKYQKSFMIRIESKNITTKSNKYMQKLINIINISL